MVNLGSVWDRTTEFLSEKRGAVLPVAALGIFAPLALFGVLMPLVEGGASPRDWALGIVLLILGAVTIAGDLMLTALAIDPAIGWRAALRIAAARLPVALIVSVAGFVAVACAIAPIYAAFLWGGGTTESAPSFGAAMFVLLYTVLLGVAGLILVARLLLFNPVLVAEAIGVRAVLRSFHLTSRMTLKLVGVVLLYVIIAQIASLAARTVFGVLFGLIAADAAATLTAIVVALVQAVASTVAAVFVARLFLAIRALRETVAQPA